MVDMDIKRQCEEVIVENRNEVCRSDWLKSPTGFLPVCCKGTTQIHVEVLQIFESYRCLDINKEDPQGHGGETDPSFCTQRKSKTIYITRVFANLLDQSSTTSQMTHSTHSCLSSYSEFLEYTHKQEPSQHKPEEPFLTISDMTKSKTALSSIPLSN